MILKKHNLNILQSRYSTKSDLESLTSFFPTLSSGNAPAILFLNFKINIKKYKNITIIYFNKDISNKDLNTFIKMLKLEFSRKINKDCTVSQTNLQSFSIIKNTIPLNLPVSIIYNKKRININPKQN
jgi:hypothetical protein